MYKICIMGSGPERFSDHAKVRRVIGQTIDHLGYQYQDVVFHVRGEIGTGLWAAQECLEQGYRYHLFLPYGPAETCKHWYDDQQKDLIEQYNNAYSLTICKPQDDGDGGESESHKRPIDDANFVVCFWHGEKAGETADAIRYAFSRNKIVLDGFNDLRLITNKDLRKTKTWKKD